MTKLDCERNRKDKITLTTENSKRKASTFSLFRFFLTTNQVSSLNEKLSSLTRELQKQLKALEVCSFFKKQFLQDISTLKIEDQVQTRPDRAY